MGLGALLRGETPRGLVRAAGKGDLDRVCRILDAGVPVDAPARNKLTALAAAASHANTPMVKLLLARGASPNTPILDGMTCLHGAAQGTKDEEIIALLLETGDPNAKGPVGVRPLHLAAQFDNLPVARALLDRGAAIDCEIDMSFPVAMVPGDLKGATPLVLAAIHDSISVLRLLLERGARREARLAHGFTALTAAVANCRPKVVSALLDAGMNPDSCPGDGIFAGCTPLMLASALGRPSNVRTALDVAQWIEGRLSIIGALLAANASTSTRDARGKTALDHAKASGFSLAVPLLEQAAQSRRT
jgi:uncharacterized protein